MHDALNHPSLGLTLDVGHVHCLSDGDVGEHVDRWARKALERPPGGHGRGIHEHLMFGDGEMDFVPVFRVAVDRLSWSRTRRAVAAWPRRRANGSMRTSFSGCSCREVAHDRPAADPVFDPRMCTKRHRQRTTPTLFDWATCALAELTPTFPCVTSSVQASMWTGVGPDRHGVIANGFYHRDRREVEFWVGKAQRRDRSRTDLGALRAARRRTSAAWHAQNIKDADADFHRHPPSRSTSPTARSRSGAIRSPSDFTHNCFDKLGHFPLQHYWGPMANIESTRWILQGRRLARSAPSTGVSLGVPSAPRLRLAELRTRQPAVPFGPQGTRRCPDRFPSPS